jgi:hypothetical protein
MINNFRGYGGNASETDNYDWWSPVTNEPVYNTLDEYKGTYIFPDGSIFNELKITTNGAVLTMTSAMGSTNLQNQGGDNFYLNDYGAPVIFKRDSNKVVESIYISVQGLELFGKKEGYQYVAPVLDLYSPPNPSGGGIDNFVYNGGDMLSGLNDALNAQIAADIEKQISAQIQAQLLADEEFRKLTEAFIEAERKRQEAEDAETERKRLEAIEAEKLAKEKAALEEEAEKKKLAAIEAEKLAKEKAALALAEAERQKLIAIEAQKEADAQKLKNDVIVTPQIIVPETPTKIADVETPIKIVEVIKPTTNTTQSTPTSTIVATKPNNTLLIGGILLGLVGLYVITKD